MGPILTWPYARGELGLPAVIGSGEKLYKLWSTASMLKLDCAAKRVEILA